MQNFKKKFTSKTPINNNEVCTKGYFEYLLKSISPTPPPPPVEKVATPIITVTDNYTEEVKVTISCATDGAVIYWTDDNWTNTYTYSSMLFFEDVGSVTIKTQAIRENMEESNIATANIVVTTPPEPGKCAIPVISIEDYETYCYITMNSSTSNAVIYYTTDGSTPDDNSYIYDGKLMLTSDCTIKAIAINNIDEDSDVSSANVDIVESDYFNFTSEGISTISLHADVGVSQEYFAAPVLYYSYDTVNWTLWQYTESGNYVYDYNVITLNDGDKIYFKGTNTKLSRSYRNTYTSFVLTGSLYAEGNLLTLLSENGVMELLPTALAKLFYNNPALKSAPYIPTVKGSNRALYGLYENCTSLQKAYIHNIIPVLATDGYISYDAEVLGYMFSGCTSLNEIHCDFDSWKTYQTGSQWLITAGWVTDIYGQMLSQNGTFYCKQSLHNAGIVTDGSIDTIPDGWTVINV